MLNGHITHGPNRYNNGSTGESSPYIPEIRGCLLCDRQNINSVWTEGDDIDGYWLIAHTFEANVLRSSGGLRNGIFVIVIRI